MREEIKIFKKSIRPFLKRQGVKKAGVFGSFARGEQGKNSDVDILVQLKNSDTLIDLVDLKIKLEDHFKKSFDIVEYKTIKPELKKRIKSEEIRIL